MPSLEAGARHGNIRRVPLITAAFFAAFARTESEVGGKRNGVVDFDVDSGTQGRADMASSDVEAPSGIGGPRNPDRVDQIRGQRRGRNVLDFLGLLVNLESRRDDEKVS